MKEIANQIVSSFDSWPMGNGEGKPGRAGLGSLKLAVKYKDAILSARLFVSGISGDLWDPGAVSPARSQATCEEEYS